MQWLAHELHWLEMDSNQFDFTCITQNFYNKHHTNCTISHLGHLQYIRFYLLTLVRSQWQNWNHQILFQFERHVKNILLKISYLTDNNFSSSWNKRHSHLSSFFPLKDGALLTEWTLKENIPHARQQKPPHRRTSIT